MRIIVCIKQVPDTTEVRLDPVTNTLIREGIPSIINPDDKSALEMALKVKDVKPDTEIIILSMGPPQAKEAIYEALSMGADHGILVSDRAFGGADTWATSSTITGAIKEIGDFDFIFAGRQAIDGDTAQVGPQIAEHLHIPQVSYAEEVDFVDEKLVIKRQFEDRYHYIEIERQCLITVISDSIIPRYPSVSSILDAYDKEIEVFDLERIKDQLDLSNIGLKGSPTKVKKSFPKQAKGTGEVVSELSADEAAQAILAKLLENYII